LKLLLRNNINISIPKPCHENWEAMTPAEKGRFCSACSKTVLDFTKASDREIVTYLSNNKNTCGRFNNYQLNRDLIIPKQKSSYWFIATASVLGFLGLNSQTVFSQIPPKIEQTDKIKTTLDTTKTTLGLKKITGVVSDEHGPIAGANVFVKGTTKGTTTDFEGNYYIDVSNNDVLVFSYTGKEIFELIITPKSNYNIKLIDSVLIAGEVIIIEPKKTFFGRQIQKVRNWFR
jgi:hypothetical protein